MPTSCSPRANSSSDESATDAMSEAESSPLRRNNTDTIPGVEMTFSKHQQRTQQQVDDDNNATTNQQPLSPVNPLVGTVVPRMEPVPTKVFFLLSLLVAIPAALYIFFFTKLGKGMGWFYYLADEYGEYASVAGAGTAVFFLLLYILDADIWFKRMWIMPRLCGPILMGGICMTTLLLVGDYPYGPICLFAAFTPLWLITLNQWHGRIRTRVYVTWLSGPLFFVSVLVGVVWLLWTFLSDENEYNQITKALFAEASGCAPNIEEHPQCVANENAMTRTITGPPGTPTANMTIVVEDNGLCFTVIESPPSFHFQQGCDPDCPFHVYDNCLNAFILWAGPLLVSLVLFFLSFFCTFLKSQAEKDVKNFGKVWIFLLFLMWLTASLAGVAAGLSSALVAMTMASFVGSVIFIAMTRSRTEGKEQTIAFWARIDENYGTHMDVARGLFLATCTPILFIYVILSIINQGVRKLGLPFSKELKTEEAKRDYLTKRTRYHLSTILSWNRTQVLTYAIYWGIAFMLMNVVVSKFTVLFLSWLIEVTSTMQLGAVTAILVGVGMVMFLLPPVPGVPIYLTLGIVIIATGRESFGIGGSMAYAAATSLGLKLLACAVQQKLIGEALSKSVPVRKMVQVNSKIIKAMRLILAQPGMSMDKVCILVGGPDWPTSVLCGIMGLDLLPVLVGTLPVFLLILPTMLTGSFTYMAGLKTEDGELEFPSAAVLATVFAAITAVVQLAAMILAGYYLEQTTTKRVEELDAIDLDQEVAELEAGEVEFYNCYNRATKWAVVPWGAKLCLYYSFGFMVACCYMVQLFSHLCFAEYQLTYTIGQHLDGNWLNLVKPMGWCAILFFFVSTLFLKGFVVWANRKTNKLLAENKPSTTSEQYRKRLEDEVTA